MQHGVPRALGALVLLAGGAAAQFGLGADLLLDGLDSPVMVAAPKFDTRLFIVSSTGLVQVLKDGVLLPTPFLDITAKVSSGPQSGLVGLCFHPGFKTNGYFYVYYNDSPVSTVLERYRAKHVAPDEADPASATAILGPITWPVQFHSGGGMAFGPDGRLWVGVGDEREWDGNTCASQRGDVLLGKLLRLADDGSIPPDNPFVNDPTVRDEIWSFGLRQPFRLSFDPLAGDLYVADVGETAREEVNLLPAGAAGGQNFGWRVLEGTQCVGYPTCAPLQCSDPFTPPLWEYDHTISGDCCIIGGALYRGTAVPGLQGKYLYAELCAGRIVALSLGASGVTGSKAYEVDLPASAFPGWLQVSSLDSVGGNLYVVDHQMGSGGAGKVWKLRVSPFEDLGFGLPGSMGVPHLDLSGTLEPNSEISLLLTQAPSGHLANLVTGLVPIFGPFKGGVLVPAPDLLLLSLPMGPNHKLALTGTWPAGVPPGVQVFLQMWVVDAAGPQGFSASGAVAFLTP
jgi:glucose/arabinose dehydrogenase